jgi:hypothetical protein
MRIFSISSGVLIVTDMNSGNLGGWLEKMPHSKRFQAGLTKTNPLLM